jgi:hypothetical protein
LPDQARFCLNCGAAVPAEPVEVHDEQPTPAGPPQPPPELDFVRPAITGGAFLGFLSSLPIVSTGNCLCCMWVLGGGGIATMLLAKQQPRRRLSFGDGAFAGVSSGLIGAIIATLVSLPIKILSKPFLESQQDSLEKMLRDMPPEIIDFMKLLISPEVSAATVLAGFISNLLVYALFAMIGGILTVAYLNKKGGGIQPPPNQSIGV